MFVGACVLDTASSADSSLHRLLVCATASPSSLISSVNVSLRLIENEPVYASLQGLYEAVRYTQRHTRPLDAGQTSETPPVQKK